MAKLLNMSWAILFLLFIGKEQTNMAVPEKLKIKVIWVEQPKEDENTYTFSMFSGQFASLVQFPFKFCGSA